MGRSVAKISPFEPTAELAKVIDNAPLVADEKVEDYTLLSSAVTAAIAPQDVVGWLLVQDAVYWSWEIRRERIVKAAAIKHHQRQVVAELLKSMVDSSDRLASANYRIFEADTDILRWSTDSTARKEIDERLAAAGHDPPSILAMAYIRGANDIDAVDRRIVAYEQRRNSALREAGYRNQYLFDQLRKIDSEIVDAAFSEAAEALWFPIRRSLPIGTMQRPVLARDRGRASGAPPATPSNTAWRCPLNLIRRGTMALRF